MSIPNSQVSSVPHYAAWREPVREKGELLRDYEVAGAALNDGTQGMQVKQWIGRVDVETTSGGRIVESRLQVSGDNGANWITLLTRPEAEVVEICIAFDNNMNPFVGFVEASGAAYRWWYDSTVPGQVLTALPAGTRSLRSCIDEKRRGLQADTDICFFFIRSGVLYVSYQRERFETEHILDDGVADATSLIAAQMNVLNRMQWTFDSGGTEDWRLPDVISEICKRAGLPQSRVSLALMDYSKIVRGYTIGSAYQAAGILQTLSSIFFFDPANANGAVSFVPRGRDTVATIIEDDMIDDGDDADIEDSRRLDNLGVPRVLHLNYYDVAGGLNTDKQRSERPEGTRADGEQSLQTPVVLSADEAASVVAITHGLMVEQQKGELSFALPDNWLRLTESDAVFVETNNKMVRAMLTRVETEDGEQRYKAMRDRQSLYRTQVQGIPAAPVTRPPSSVAGATALEFLDIAILRDTHDQLGFYIAVSGILPAWPGAQVELSLDGGETYIESQSTNSSSIVGELVSALGPHPHEYPDETNAVQVYLKTPDALLENTDLAGMMNRRNRALIGDETVAFGDADESSPGTWQISHLLRGRKGTSSSGTHSVGERFVLLDTAMFIPADLSWLNRTLTFRAATFGRPIDEATIASVMFIGRSQRELAPAYLQARRDGIDAVVSWQGVGRLGSSVHVAMGAYFAGYRLTLTDGTTTREIDTAATTYTGSLTAFTGPVTVRVQQRNQLTGLGPHIEVTV